MDLYEILQGGSIPQKQGWDGFGGLWYQQFRIEGPNTSLFVVS